MSTLRAYLGTAGLTDVGYRLYTRNTPVAARSTTDILDEGDGWYSAGTVTLAGDNVRWDSISDATAIAREDLTILIFLTTLSGITITSGKVDVGKINGATVLGSGIPSDLWRG